MRFPDGARAAKPGLQDFSEKLPELKDFLDFLMSGFYIISPMEDRFVTRTLFPTVVLLLLSVSVALSGGIRDGSLSAYSNGSSIVLRWVSEDETNITGYVIERKAGIEGTFIRLTDSPIASKGSGASYEFTDITVYRTTGSFYQYRITAVGSGLDPYYVSVTHTVNGVMRRTWGSIKAMFR